MEQRIADLSKEQEQKLRQMESELGCVLIAYESKEQTQNNVKFH